MMFRLWIALFTTFLIYTAFVYTSCDPGKPEVAHPSSQIVAGWNTWQQKNCQTCHQLYGLGGYMGPDLTNVASDPLKSTQYLFTFIRYGTGKMPNFNLSDTEINNLVAFLKWVDKSGQSIVTKDHVTSFGNYNLDN
jgi:nitric oxide reductase subunit C